MKIGVDLLWVRPGICGGTESVIRNLLEGFGRYGRGNRYLLFVSEDNADSFRRYEKPGSIELEVCGVASGVPARRILWENLHLDRLASRRAVDVMFIPVYSKPLSRKNSVPYCCVIHDLQALHYPQYFSRIRRLFFKYMWGYACRTSRRVVAISNYCREDLLRHYPEVKDKCRVIYNPVDFSDRASDFGEVAEKYGLEKDGYFYCVSSMLPHKNLDTLLGVMALRKRQGRRERLVISGVGGQKDRFLESVRAQDIEDVVTDTGFVTDEERNCLYENCRAFLFPSIFEGFGMPPVEALGRGKPVVMTRESCLEEITLGRACYVDKPGDEEEWSLRIEEALARPAEKVAFPDYQLEQVVKNYEDTFCHM